jgi:hypothetical protein
MAQNGNRSRRCSQSLKVAVASSSGSRGQRAEEDEGMQWVAPSLWVDALHAAHAALSACRPTREEGQAGRAGQAEQVVLVVGRLSRWGEPG